MTRKRMPSPGREALEGILREAGKQEICRRYGVSFPVVNRWLREEGVTVRPYHGLSYEIPADFKDWYEQSRPTWKEIEERYQVSSPVFRRWLRSLEIKHSGRTVRRFVPEETELARLNETMTSDQMALHYGVSPTLIRRWFIIRGLTLRVWNSGTSLGEKEVVDFIGSLGVEVVQGSRRIIPPLQLDAYIPSRSVAFEYDGSFWHSASGPRDHLAKMLAARDAGIKLFRIHEFEWIYKGDLVRSMIASRLGKSRRVYARKCELVAVSSGEAFSFHETNHVSGGTGSSVSVGLRLDGRLVTVMSFSRSRYSGGLEWEMARYSSLAGVTVVGGAARMFSRFVEDVDASSVLSFCDLRWGTGKVYENLGFRLAGEGPPTYWYFDREGRKHSRMAFQKSKLERKLETFDPELSETDNMLRNGYFKYWDCGSARWEWTK